MKVAISTSAFGSKSVLALNLLKDKSIEIIENPYGRRLTEPEIIEHLKDVDGLLAGLEPLNRNVLSSASQLKAVARVGVGTANVDFTAAAELGIKVSNTPEGPTFAVAEMTLTALLSLLRNFPDINAKMHRGEWPKEVHQSLYGKTVLILGFGRIGAKVAEMISVFEANIIVYDPLDVALPEYCTKVSFEAGLQMADVISIHTGGEAEIIGETEFEQMKPGVYILNSARGNLINEQSLISNLENKRVAGVWLDAFWEEPYVGELIQNEAVLMTPHLSTYTETCRETMELDAAKNLLRDLGID
ncbi:MAG: hydroxyacid dehydrogenase [Candidatus Marinimicrobia bacterium]|nr:hydroxyacid dehydrogenase [Candidatus Neomarinimicrobiota bacterium]MCF7922117.1 hydroxyacid dehydrogenase [Candidatus Neomarinimicrobiota bacterium]